MPTANSHFRVKNLKGTSDNKCKRCKSWIRHWRNHAKSIRSICCVLGCTNEAEVGAHVLIADRRTNQQWWIVPFCRKHNHYRNVGNMLIDVRTMLVSANVGLMCE